MLTQSEYAIRMMEMRGGVSLIDTLIAYRECRAPLKPRCLFGPSDKKENLDFAKTALMNDRKQFFNRYSLVEPSQQDLIFELCNSVKRKLQAGESGRTVKVRKSDSKDRKRKIERCEARKECCEGVQLPKVPCLVTPAVYRSLEEQEELESHAKQTHITDFWQIKRRQLDSSKQLNQALPSSTSMGHSTDQLAAV